MIINGKYNEAEIFTENIDSTTISQIINLCNQDFLKESKIRIMPDCHAGKGCTIGTTMTITDKVVPNLVGVDIGCGVAAIKVIEELDLEKLDKVIREHIPHGFNTCKESREDLLKNIFDIDLNKIKCNINNQRAFLSLGTLGGGNHFIEVDATTNKENYLIVHTGSRNLGKNIAEYYQEKAIKYCTNKYDNSSEKEDLIRKLKKEGRTNEINIELEKLKKKSRRPQDDLCYLEGDLMKDYLHDMEIAQKYSAANRVVILANILYNYYEIKEDFNKYCKNISKDIIECIHNYIDIENKILRKGAISAQKDEKVLIPINMRDGIIVAKGKGNENWNCSAPHGAGRILSRGQAKQTISLEDFKETMKGIYSTCIGETTLDEAPQAYKSLEDILMYIHETVDIIEVIKPIYNFKSN